MTRLVKFLRALALPLALVLALALPLTGFSAASHAATAETVEITGEVIDTWCYLSGVMGGPEAVTGSAHHACALWCAAGGIPVGVLADDGRVYMVLKLNGEEPLAQTDSIMKIQSDRITARGTHYVRDGVNYLVVEKIVANEGITSLSHETFGVTPGFAIPKPKN